MAPIKEKKSKSWTLFYVLPVLVAIAIPLLKFHATSDPISFILPNLLLFTNLREETKQLWAERVKIDTAIHMDTAHIPIIEYKDYTFERLKQATENFRYPAVVRGMFLDTPAATKWLEPNYLASKIGDYRIPVVMTATYGTLQNDRNIMSFREAYEDVLADEQSKKYLFFPVKSRFSFNGSELGSLNSLQEELNKITLEDLELHRIWKGFGTDAHKTYFGSQLIVGRGTNDSDATTGTGWHCAAGNNWFIQVVGKKRWYFMDPKYSAYMYPLRGGKVNMMTGNRNMGELQKHLPIRHADILAGDLLYNPDWEWHTIKNYEGLSIGCPIREVNISLSIQNNLQYTSLVLVNKLFEKFGIDIGGYPPN